MFIIEDVLTEKDKYGHWIYKGVCQECGFERFSHYGGFKNPLITKCTHIGINGSFIKYGVQWTNSRIASIFSEMKRRCYNSACDDYYRYGGRGIKICDEWLNNPEKFEEWSLCNGYNEDLTIDRKNNDNDYCPENCRWVSVVVNSKYKSTTRLLDVDGEIHTGRDWAKILNISINQINIYVRKYGIDNTVEFIRRFLKNPNLCSKGQNYYEFYMHKYG